MSAPPRVLTILGPTASGKTPLSILLAEKLHGEIVSADSRQVFRHLDIGTAKPSKQELKRVRHHLTDILNPDEEYNAGQFGKDVEKIIRQIFRRKRLPIVVGGSGLYLKAVIDGLFEGPGKDPELRNQLEERLAAEGAEALLETLRKFDPVSASTMAPEKPRRIIRALEVYYITGIPLSKFHAEQRRESPFTFIQIGLEWDRAELYRRINQRVDMMLEHGLVDEVKSLQEKGFDRRFNALNTVGYKEMFEYLEGKTSLEKAIELTKRNSRRFAKRQLTWFRADKRIRWVKVSGETDFVQLANTVAKAFKAK